MDLPFKRATEALPSVEPLFIQDGIQECLNAHHTCLFTIRFCLRHGGSRYTHPKLLGMLQTCAEITSTCAHLLIFDSSLQKQLCQLAAQSCSECATACESFSDGVMLECAEVCQDCAEICRRILG